MREPNPHLTGIIVSLAVAVVSSLAAITATDVIGVMLGATIALLASILTVLSVVRFIEHRKESS